MKTVLITGASGTVGFAALMRFVQLKDIRCRIFLRLKKSNLHCAHKLKKKYPHIEVLFGDVLSYEDCCKAVNGVDYIVHCAAMIPPAADHYPDKAYRINYEGTENLVRAACALNSENGRKNTPKFIYIGSVAEYGNRTYKHPWGRTGDPLIPSVFDAYGAGKIRAERAVIEAPLCWTVLRLSAVLYDSILFNNIKDGLMFHTAWNAPIEWTTVKSTALLLANLIEKDVRRKLPAAFWKKVYNVGNGKKSRVTGYETFDRGFKMMGCGAEKIFQPEWNVLRNSHCLWFADSQLLNQYLDFQCESFEDFFVKLEKKLWYYKCAAPFFRLIKRFVIMPLLQTNNAPAFWIMHKDKKRIDAFFGSLKAYKAVAKKWKDFFLLCKNQNPENGAFLDYKKLKDESFLRERGLLLDHGYDDTKKTEALGIEDMRQAAVFRGGLCVSSSMKSGDMYTPLQWRCHQDHVFCANPYTVLKAGHWCPVCCTAPPWNFAELAKHIPFYAQVWYDDHGKDEVDV
ncbi:NAD(P)-dependent oxidoreductase [Treponema sp. OMZ 840]|uniref:NAD-dependent epimerase/dehydratase family protein n=1 Tax=Treponema sp. OMZ 840 TaxID=244313 RepID=UPI003D8F3A6E